MAPTEDDRNEDNSQEDSSYESEESDISAKHKAVKSLPIISSADYAQEPRTKPLAESNRFCCWVALTLVGNLFVIGLETDLGCMTCSTEERGMWLNLDILFSALFIVEFLVQLLSYMQVYGRREDPILTRMQSGLSRFYLGDPLAGHGLDVLHCVDSVIVLLRAVDLVLSLAGAPAALLKLASMLRVYYFIRWGRTLNLGRGFRELWLIMAGVGDTLKILFWVAILLVLFTWVFAVCLRQTTTNLPQTMTGDSARWTADEYWETVPKSMYTSFEILMLDGFSDIVAHLVRKDFVYIIPVMILVCIGVLSLFNLIIGVVVETTFASSKANGEVQIKEIASLHAQVLQSMHDMFHEADADRSGYLDREELREAMRNPDIRSQLRVLELPVRDMEILYNLLDTDNTGTIPTNKFFRALARLRGVATASDVHSLSVDLDRHIKMSDVLICQQTENNDLLASLLDHIDMVDVQIVRGDSDGKDPVLMRRRDRLNQGQGRTQLRSSKLGESKSNLNFPGVVAQEDCQDLRTMRSMGASKTTSVKSPLKAERSERMMKRTSKGHRGQSLRHAAGVGDLPAWGQHQEQPEPPPLPAHIVRPPTGQMPAGAAFVKSVTRSGSRRLFAEES
mmetsp:Transcript_54424/g.117795  ORF Transcript_54424/g.117795 Transcript_54424/m.117795 type:complete len:621 (+) Transcript_54424:86-1948(+)